MFVSVPASVFCRLSIELWVHRILLFSIVAINCLESVYKGIWFALSCLPSFSSSLKFIATQGFTFVSTRYQFTSASSITLSTMCSDCPQFPGLSAKENALLVCLRHNQEIIGPLNPSNANLLKLSEQIMAVFREELSHRCPSPPVEIPEPPISPPPSQPRVSDWWFRPLAENLARLPQKYHRDVQLSSGCRATICKMITDPCQQPHKYCWMHPYRLPDSPPAQAPE